MGVEQEFLPAALEIQQTPPHPMARVNAWLIILFTVAVIVWACIGRVDIVAIAQGKIIPSARVKIIQPFERGVVKRIFVRDGQQVAKGDVLLELDPTESRADESHLRNEFNLARLVHARLQALYSALRDGSSAPRLPEDAAPEARRSELSLQHNILTEQYLAFKARSAQLDKDIAARAAEIRSTRLKVDALKHVLPIVTKRAGALDSLRHQSLVSEHDYLAVEQDRIEKAEELAVTSSRIEELLARLQESEQQRKAFVTEHVRQILLDLQESARKLTMAEQEYVKARQRAQRTTLTAPASGVVQQLAIHTEGGVVTPAQRLMVIVPAEGGLEIEAWLPNKDIGFVHEGQSAEAKVETFPFTRYGTIAARITSVSDDAVKNDSLGLVYAARALLRTTSLDVDGRQVHLTPGMAVTLEVRTGRRRIIEFVLSPILKALRESARER